MQTKLTLSIDKQVIEKAKQFAHETDRSLSEIVESYLSYITDEKIENRDPEIDRLLGVISLSDDFDEKKEIRKILSEKHNL